MSSGSSSRIEQFEAIDWESVTDDGADGRNWRTWAFVSGLLLVLAGFLYAHLDPSPVQLLDSLEPLDWLLVVSLLALATYVVEPTVRNREMTMRYWKRLKQDKLGVAGFAYVLTFFAVGLVGPLLVSPPKVHILQGFQPPVGLTVDADFAVSCVGEVTDGRCHGTWRYPLGTTSTGQSLLPFLVYGARTSLTVALVSATLLVPTGVAVGLLAASAGGRTDATLMWFAEILQTIPAILVYFLLFWWIFDYRLLVMVTVFGLASWGSLARLVRNRVLAIREKQYVQAAKGTGADRSQRTRWHLLPNVSSTVLTAVTLQIPMLILMEASLSFLVIPAGFGGVTLGDPTVASWGQRIYRGLSSSSIYPGWWITVFPALLLVGTVFAFNAFGNALVDAFDPRDAY